MVVVPFGEGAALGGSPHALRGNRGLGTNLLDLCAVILGVAVVPGHDVVVEFSLNFLQPLLQAGRQSGFDAPSAATLLTDSFVDAADIDLEDAAL